MHCDISQRYLAKNQTEYIKRLDDTLFEVDECLFGAQEDLEDELEGINSTRHRGYTA